MDGIERDWNGVQWVGDQGATSVSSVNEPDPLPRWHSGQWAGVTDEFGGRRSGVHNRRPNEFSGFSGFGHAMAGGQRWASGYGHDSLTGPQPRRRSR
jgi:hypothetical protein